MKFIIKEGINIFLGLMFAGILVFAIVWTMSHTHKIRDLWNNERTYWIMQDSYCMDGYRTDCGMNLSYCYKKKNPDPFTRLCVKEYQEIKLKLGEEAK